MRKLNDAEGEMVMTVIVGQSGQLSTEWNEITVEGEDDAEVTINASEEDDTVFGLVEDTENGIGHVVQLRCASSEGGLDGDTED